MELTRAIKIMACCLIIAIAVFVQTAHAINPKNDSTIENSSLDWVDPVAREQLLALVPNWTSTTIQSVFEEYLHPERHDLPILINGRRVNYDALFINAFWGPIDNPFNKLPRPAKIFIFVKDMFAQSSYYMAPIVKNDNDKKFYVFDKSFSQAIELTYWVYTKTNGFPCSVRFNICTGYGVSPKDSCDGKTFESEIYSYPFDINVSKKLNYQSAHRTLNQQWFEVANSKRPSKSLSPDTAIDTSVPWIDIEKRETLLKSIVTWPNYQIIKENFKKIRDLRYFQDETVDRFVRRISWLFPDDGCWTRLGAIIKDFFGPRNNMANDFARPSKVFAFGNLCVNTTNTSSGSVTWWYHVAAIVRDATTNESYVLDPSVNPKEPTPIDKWIELISANNGDCAKGINSVSNFNICNGYGIAPYDGCDYKKYEHFEKEISAMLINRFYRRFERSRQIELGRVPDDVLGNQPPW
jgi:Glutaminase